MESPGPDDLRFVAAADRLQRRRGGATATVGFSDRLLLRGAIAVGVLLLVLVAIFVRVAQLQLFLADELEALDSTLHPAFARAAGPPGDILDAYGRVIATSKPVWAVKINPREFRALVKDTAKRQKAAELLAQALGKPVAEIQEVLSLNRSWAYLARRVDQATRDRVRTVARKHKIPSVTFDKEYQRVYVLDGTACHAVGWRGADQHPRAGLEAVYRFVLTGQRGSARGATDRWGREIPWPDHGRPYPGRPAKCLVTTLDLDVQHSLESALDEVVARYRPQRAMGIVIDPRTGEILAVAARPGFDPNDFGKIGKGRRKVTREDLINPTTQWGFEPGSCLKPFVVAAALEEGLTSEDERFYCNGLFTEVPGPPIHCAHGARHGWLTLTDVVARSCNVSAARLAVRIGGRRLLEWLRRFGFGRPTGIELPEGLGLLPPGPGRRLYPRDVACLGFGQGLSVTLIQLATAYAGLVNDGVCMLPHLVKAVVNQDGSLYRRVDPVEVGRVCSAETSRKIRAMLKSVVERGTGKAARIPGVAVGGKTGTADRPKPGGGFEGYVASFVMVLPVQRPQYVIAIVVDKPRGGHYGGVVAAPAAKKVALTLLRIHRQISAIEGARPRRNWLAGEALVAF